MKLPVNITPTDDIPTIFVILHILKIENKTSAQLRHFHKNHDHFVNRYD